MIKSYTITTNGDDNGNVIAQPFTIEILSIQHYNDEGGEGTIVTTCTKNASGVCGNSQIETREPFDRQANNLTTDQALTATIEAKLDTVYGNGNWS